MTCKINTTWNQVEWINEGILLPETLKTSLSTELKFVTAWDRLFNAQVI